MLQIETLFLLLTVVGFCLLAYAIADVRLHKKFHPELIAEKFQSEPLQKAFRDAGLNVSAQKFLLIRFFGFVGYEAVLALSSWISGSSFPIVPALIGVLLLLATSTVPVSPLGLALSWLKKRHDLRKDAELISFLILYEKSWKRRGYQQFSEFCRQRAAESKYLQPDLLILARRVDEEGIEKALDHFVSRFPPDHPFVKDIRSIIIAVEGMKDSDAAIKYLEDQSRIISGISSDVYSRKWKLIGDIGNIFNTLPAMILFLMAVLLIVQYTAITMENFQDIGG